MFRQDTSIKTQEETAHAAFWEKQPYTDPLAQCQPLKVPKLKIDPRQEDLTELLLWGIFHFRHVRDTLIWNFNAISHKELRDYFDRFAIDKYIDFPKKRQN